MNNRLKTNILVFPVLLAALISGCVGKPLIIPSPAWHLLKSGIYDAADGKVFYGIGHAGGFQNLTLLRATADNHARKELAMVLDRYIAELAQSARFDQDPAWKALSSAEQQQLLSTLARNALQLAVISDHWSDSRESRLSALCRLDLTQFKLALSDPTVLTDRLRAVMGAEVENVHNQLSQHF